MIPTSPAKLVLTILALAACGGNDGGAASDDDSGFASESSAGSAASTLETTAATNMTTSTTAATSTTSTSETTGPQETGAEGPSTTGDPGQLPYDEEFGGEDGAPWPSPWAEVGTHVLAAELEDGRARLAGETIQVARMILPGFEEVDVDVTVTVELDNWFQQGFGFYVRQNGGALLETDPPGQGYAIYTEGGFQGTLGLWREIDGVETMIASIPDPIAGGVLAQTPYRVRFQCIQESDSTRLRAKMWIATASEPDAWMVETTDSSAQLQGTAGSFAADVYNYSGTGSIWIDDLSIMPAT